MKKYQLKYNNGTELEIICESDILYDILFEVRYIQPVKYILEALSVWIDGKVLE